MNITTAAPSPTVLFKFLARAYGADAAERIFRFHGLPVPAQDNS